MLDSEQTAKEETMQDTNEDQQTESSDQLNNIAIPSLSEATVSTDTAALDTSNVERKEEEIQVKKSGDVFVKDPETERFVKELYEDAKQEFTHVDTLFNGISEKLFKLLSIKDCHIYVGYDSKIKMLHSIIDAKAHKDHLYDLANVIYVEAALEFFHGQWSKSSMLELYHKVKVENDYKKIASRAGDIAGNRVPTAKNVKQAIKEFYQKEDEVPATQDVVEDGGKEVGLTATTVEEKSEIVDLVEKEVVEPTQPVKENPQQNPSNVQESLEKMSTLRNSIKKLDTVEKNKLRTLLKPKDDVGMIAVSVLHYANQDQLNEIIAELDEELGG